MIKNIASKMTNPPPALQIGNANREAEDKPATRCELTKRICPVEHVDYLEIILENQLHHLTGVLVQQTKTASVLSRRCYM
jgi:hypothetical protein